jgi:hypothetical protein
MRTRAAAATRAAAPRLAMIPPADVLLPAACTPVAHDRQRFVLVHAIAFAHMHCSTIPDCCAMIFDTPSIGARTPATLALRVYSPHTKKSTSASENASAQPVMNVNETGRIRTTRPSQAVARAASDSLRNTAFPVRYRATALTGTHGACLLVPGHPQVNRERDQDKGQAEDVEGPIRYFAASRAAFGTRTADQRIPMDMLKRPCTMMGARREPVLRKTQM